MTDSNHPGFSERGEAAEQAKLAVRPTRASSGVDRPVIDHNDPLWVEDYPDWVKPDDTVGEGVLIGDLLAGESDEDMRRRGWYDPTRRAS